MDSSILLILLQDGIVNGAVYALLSLSLVLVFAVTRVIFLPQGEFVTYGALTLAALEQGQTPGTVWLLLILGFASAVSGLYSGRFSASTHSRIMLLAETVALPLAVFALTRWLAPLKLGHTVEILLTLAIVVPMGPYVYRLAFRPLLNASVLVLLIASVGLHLCMTGLGLIFFGAEGSRTSSLSDAAFELGPWLISGQTIIIGVVTTALIGALYAFFGATMLGKALRATAINRTGAQLVGISPSYAGSVAFTLAAFIGVLSGILIAPVTTIYYDTGFLIGLKGFVGAIVGGLASYPLAAAAAIFVGMVESFASFWASEFKEVIVFTIIIPVLLWRSWRSPVIEEGDDSGDPQLTPGRSTGSVRWVSLVSVSALLFAAPLLPGISPFLITLLNYIGIYSIVGIGLVVLTGSGGITSFGQAVFVGTGAYTTAILTLRYGLSPWQSLPVALGAAASIAFVIGSVTLRLSGHYLAVATLAWNVSFFYIVAKLDFFGRNDGLSGVPPITVGGINLVRSDQIYDLIWIFVGIAGLLTHNLLNSRVGRAIRALKGGVVAAEAFGIDTARIKLIAFVYAGLLAGLSGWLYAHLQRTVSPAPFGLNASIEYLLMVVVGGASSIGGAIAGSAIVTVLRDQLQDTLPKLFGSQVNLEGVVFGAALIVILQTARGGLWPYIAALIPGALSTKARSFDKVDTPRLPHRERSARSKQLLSVRGLRKTFDGLVAVDDIGFDVAAGEIVALIGPNGAGKTTTFNVMTGVSPATAGAIRFGDRHIEGLSSRDIARLGMARTFQHVKLVPSMTVIENVALGAHVRGSAGVFSAVLSLDRTEEASLFREARCQLGRVGLGAMADHTATSLALGQQRIVEIARALCLDPVLLLLDEPAAGLRHREKADLARLLGDLREEGFAIVLVEHDMDFVMNLADRLVVMNFGTKLAEGAPSTVRANPVVIDAYLGGAV